MELFDILDGEGKHTGKTKLRSEVHAEGDWHRSVHLWIVNNKDEVLLQKRSIQKDSYPGLWDISTAGHISAGETSLEGIIKEAREELGLIIKEGELKYLFTTVSKDVHNNGKFINNEFNDIYLMKVDLDISKLVLQEEEVSDVKWIDKTVLLEINKRGHPDYCIHNDEYIKLFDCLSGN